MPQRKKYIIAIFSNRYHHRRHHHLRRHHHHRHHLVEKLNEGEVGLRLNSNWEGENLRLNSS